MATARRGRRKAGFFFALFAALCAVLILVPTVVPSGTPAAMPFDAALPWLGVPILLLFIAALARKRWLGVLGALAAGAVWCGVFLAVAWPLDDASARDWEKSGATSLTVLSQNLQGAAGGPEASAHTADAAAKRDPDLIALQEVDAASLEAVTGVLAEQYPYRATVGTVGLWSRYPLGETEPLDLGLGWKRALRVAVDHPDGPVAVYLVHAASARLTSHEQRDDMILQLTELVRADPSDRIVAVGDFNAGSHDRVFKNLTYALKEPAQSSGGFGFTWPSQVPLVRLDHILVRGFDASDSRTLRLGESDHRAIIATIWPRV